jgi:hypothetical protein
MSDEPDVKSILERLKERIPKLERIETETMGVVYMRRQTGEDQLKIRAIQDGFSKDNLLQDCRIRCSPRSSVGHASQRRRHAGVRGSGRGLQDAEPGWRRRSERALQRDDADLRPHEKSGGGRRKKIIGRPDSEPGTN